MPRTHLTFALIGKRQCFGSKIGVTQVLGGYWTWTIHKQPLKLTTYILDNRSCYMPTIIPAQKKVKQETIGMISDGHRFPIASAVSDKKTRRLKLRRPGSTISCQPSPFLWGTSVPVPKPSRKPSTCGIPPWLQNQQPGGYSFCWSSSSSERLLTSATRQIRTLEMLSHPTKTMWPHWRSFGSTWFKKLINQTWQHVWTRHFNSFILLLFVVFVL